MLSSLDTARPSIAAQIPNVEGASRVIEAARGPSGLFQGESIRPTTQNSLISQAREGVSTVLKTDLLTLATRFIRQGQATNAAVATSRIAEFYGKLPDMPARERLEELIQTIEAEIEARIVEEPQEIASAAEEVLAEIVGDETMQQAEKSERLRESGEDVVVEGERDGASGPSTSDIFAALQNFDPDVTHQFAALEIVREHFEQRSAKGKLRTLLDQAKEAFEASSEMIRDIRAGFAAAPAAHDFALLLGGDPVSTSEISGTFRDTYRQMLRQENHFGRLFDAIKKFDLTKSFSEIIDVFLSAVGRDVSSTGPSTDRHFLHALMTELGKLKNLRSVFESGKGLIETAERGLVPSAQGLVDPTSLVSNLLNFCAKAAVNLSDARQLLHFWEGSSLSAQVVLVNGIVDLHAGIPDSVIAPRARQQQKITLNTLRDHVVAAEEEHYEARAKSDG